MPDLPVWAWIVVGVAAWMVVAAVVGVTIGRTIRNRDRQAARDRAAARPCPCGGLGCPVPRIPGGGRG